MPARAASAVCLALLAACGGETVSAPTSPAGPTTPVAVVASVTVTPPSPAMIPGQRVQLITTLKDSTGQVLAARPVTWASADTAVATVTTAGLVTAVAAGKTAISATLDARVGTAAVIVTDPTTFVNATSVHGGYAHTCALVKSGAAYCWGDNNFGQVGNGTTVGSAVPLGVGGGISYTAIGAASGETCGLATSGKLYCWGLTSAADEFGQGPTTSSASPVLFSSQLTFASLTDGSLHMCALTATGAAYCWGDNEYGVFGDSGYVGSVAPRPSGLGLTFTSLSAGSFDTCGLTAGHAAYCWGNNYTMELGDGSSTERLTPTAVSGGLAFAMVRAGIQYTCGLTTSGAAYCWGNFGTNAYTANGVAGSATPAALPGGLTFTALDVSRGSGADTHACALVASGAAWCWGSNRKGQLGNGTTVNSAAPVPVSGGLTFTALTTGSAHTCGLTAGGALYCWGDNNLGQLGNGLPDNSTAPVRVIGPP